MVRKRLAFVLIIIVGIALLSTCRSSESIKIGYAGTLSGVNSELGVSGRNAAKMAVDQINNSGGIKGKYLELLIKDDQNDQEAALEADKALYKEGAMVIIGHMTSGMSDLTVPYINQKGILMLSPTIAADTLTSLNDYFLRMIPSNVEQASAIAEVMHLEKIKKAAVVYDTANLTFSEGIKNQFIADYLDCCGTVIYQEGFSSKQVDFQKLAGRLLNSGAEGVFIIAASDNASLLCQNLYKQGSQIKLFLPSWAMTTDLLNHGGKSIEGAHLVNFYSNESTTEEYQSFVKAYTSEFGIKPGFSAQFSYEAVMIIAEALINTKEFSAATLKDYIINRETFSGLQGDLAFDEFGDMNRQLYNYKVQNGEFKIIEYGELQ